MKWLRRALIALAILALLCAAPIAYVETSCRRRLTLPSEAASPFVINRARLSPRRGRQLPDLSRMVHRARLYRSGRRDAAILGIGVRLFRQHHRLLAQPLPRDQRRRRASGRSPSDQKITNYIIGLSFTAEMSIIGALRALDRRGRPSGCAARATHARGRVRAWLSPTITPPSCSRRRGIAIPSGRNCSASGARRRSDRAASLRSIERRLALQPRIWRQGALRHRHRRPRRLFSRRSQADEASPPISSADDLAAEPKIRKLRDLGDSATLIETPRYQEYTEILRQLGARGRTSLKSPATGAY